MLKERLTNTRLIFRAINDDLEKLMNSNVPTQLEIQNKLIVINEELCDYVVEMVKIIESSKTLENGN